MALGDGRLEGREEKWRVGVGRSWELLLVAKVQNLKSVAITVLCAFPLVFNVNMTCRCLGGE